MKKAIILFITLLCLSCMSGCNSNKKIDTKVEDKVNDKPSEVKYIDNNPIKVGLYQNDNLVTHFNTKLANFKDIAIFNVLYTNEPTVEKIGFKNNWYKYYNQYENIDEYKIGFFISFEGKDEHIEKLVLNSNSIYDMGPYLYVYLYDDINQEDYSWYSHIEPSDENENTIFSSIKLFMCEAGTSITSPIELTVFTYKDENDFDSFNHYRGNSSYTITIDIE